MIGNDIVDLDCARRESRWQRPRFLKKLFSLREQLLIKQSPKPETMVWLLWSMKESAYKVWMQKGGQRSFAPKRFACFLFHSDAVAARGKVRINDEFYLTQTNLQEKYIHTVAEPLEECKGPRTRHNQVRILKEKNYANQSFRLRQWLIEDFSTKKNLPPSFFRIDKNGGIPYLHHKERRLTTTSISLSHHGNYGAYAWQEAKV